MSDEAVCGCDSWLLVEIPVHSVLLVLQFVSQCVYIYILSVNTL